MICGEVNKPEIIHKKDLFSNENIFRLKDEVKLKFPKEFLGYTLVGLHTFNISGARRSYFACMLKNKFSTIIKAIGLVRYFAGMEQEFIIDEESFIACNYENLAITDDERLWWAGSNVLMEHFDLVELFLVKNPPKVYEIPSNKEYIKPENDFSHLIPPVEFYKEIIEDYNAVLLKLELFPNLNALMQN